jgi:hypothetical protein
VSVAVPLALFTTTHFHLDPTIVGVLSQTHYQRLVFGFKDFVTTLAFAHFSHFSQEQLR